MGTSLVSRLCDAARPHERTYIQTLRYRDAEPLNEEEAPTLAMGANRAYLTHFTVSGKAVDLTSGSTPTVARSFVVTTGWQVGFGETLEKRIFL